MKKLLLLNGSYNEIGLIHAAHRLGYYVITTGNDPSGEGHKYANQYRPCDYSDKEAVYQLAREECVDAICACSNDFGALSAAYACEKLGLPGHDRYETSRLFHEKDCFRKMARELCLPVPEAAWFEKEDEAAAFVEALPAACFPKIVKPADLSGGKGIRTVYDRVSGLQAVRGAFSKSKVKRIVIEDYIEGQQQGITVFLRGGKAVLEYSTNDYAYENPYMVWMAFGSPADHYGEYRDRLIGDIEKIAGEKKIADGFLTIQYMLRNGVPYYLETMRRCLGNQHYQCMSRDLGVDFYELYIRAECGEDCAEYLRRQKPSPLRSGFMAFFAPSNGVVSKVTVDPEFQKKLFDIKMLNGPGYRVTDYLNDKLGLMFFTLSEADLSWFRERKKELFQVVMEEEEQSSDR